MKDILFLKLKKYHIGCMRAVSSRELEAAFGVKSAEIHRAINALRSECEPICNDENGYYYAKNEYELKACIRQLDRMSADIC